jgi:hypothetical protein
MTCLRSAAELGAAVVNVFACGTCVPDQARAGANVFLALMHGVGKNVIILQQSEVIMPAQICHNQKVLMLKEKVFAPVCQQSLRNGASGLRR